MTADDTIQKGEDFLAHYGVKGMKWGVRKDRDGAPSKRQQKKADKAEYKDWKKNAMGTETANKAFQDASKSFEKPLKRINNDPAFKGKDLTAPENRRLARTYDEVVSEVFNQHLAQASVNLTYNEKAKRAVIYQFDRNVGMMKATLVRELED